MSRLAFLRTNEISGGTCLIALVSFLQMLFEIRLAVETMLQNINCFIVYILSLIVVLDRFHKQGIVF